VVPLAETNCERAIETEETLVLTDIASEAPDLATRGGFTEQGIRCYIGTPVRVDGEIYGTFCFYDREVRSESFSEWEITLVDFMGKWIGYELERQRREAELTRQRDRFEDFANIVAHDLRNPLNVAEVQLQLARKQFDSECLDEVDAALTRMEEIIDAVFTLARVGQADLDCAVIDVEAVGEDAAETVASDSLSLTIEDELGRTIGDEGLVQQLFENLLRNALDHAGSEPTVRVGALDGGLYLEDDGPGIPETERELVFQDGYSNRREGTGFGLSIVEAVVDVHGWSITLTESSTGGARFEIEGMERP
jgi:signal transduction histidine kinase